MKKVLVRKKLVSVISIILCILMTAQVFAVSSGFAGHREAKQLNRWAKSGYLSILADPVTNPDRVITRAEWVALVSELFGYKSNCTGSYKDVPTDKWYYEAVMLATSANIVSGYEGYFRPDAPISREEMAVSIVKALGMESEKSDLAMSYKDYDDISGWSRNAIGVCMEKGIMNGITTGYFQPRRSMSVAEAVTLLDGIAPVILNEPAAGGGGYTLTYSKNVKGNLFVNASNVILRNMKVSGNLYIAQTCPVAEISLENVEVSERIYVTGANRVVVDESVSNNKIFVYQVAGKISVLSPNASVITAQLPSNVSIIHPKDKSSAVTVTPTPEPAQSPVSIPTPIPTSTPVSTPSDEVILIEVTNRMLDGEDYANEKAKLFDEYEQVLSSPPTSVSPYIPPINTEAKVNANTWRTPGSSQWNDVTVTNLNLDLLREYQLFDIYLYDGEKYAPSTYTTDGSSPFEVMGGTFEVYSGNTKLITYPLTNEGKWVKFDFGEEGILTESLRFVKIPIEEKYSWWGGSGTPYSKMFTCDVNIAEVALYGIPLGEEPDEEEEWILRPQEGVEPFDDSNLTFSKFVGSNSFFDVTQNSHEAIGFIREYHYWNWTEWSANGQMAGGQYNNSAMTQEPDAHFNNVWGVFDNYYQSLKNMGIDVNIAFNSGVANSGRDNPRPNWQGDMDPKKASSYLAHGQSMFQHAARYGSNQDIDPDLVKVAPGTEKKIGLDLVKYYENWNEQNLWGHFTGAQFAAMTSADYDGHMGTMGPNVGIKQADPNAKLVLGGFAGILYKDNTPVREQSTREFFEDMMKWFDENRTEDQWKAAHNGSLEGYVRYPFDVLNGHFYTGEGVYQPNAENNHTSISAEEDRIYDRMVEFVALRDTYLVDKEIWLSEFGWDVYQGTESSATVEYEKDGITYNEGINTGLDAEEVQGRWLVREFLMLAAAGIDRVQQYMMPDADNVERRNIRFNTSGLIRADGNNTHQTTQKRPSWYYVGTMKHYLDTTRFDSIIEKGGESGLEGPWVIKFDETVNDDSVYSMWLPTSLGDQNGENKQDYTLTLPDGTTHAYLVSLKDGVKWGERTEIEIVNSNKVTVSVTEKPVFVLATKEEYYKPIPEAIRPVSINKLTQSNSNPNLMMDMRLTEPMSMTHQQATAAGTYWDPGTGDRYAIIDLGSEFNLNSLLLFDGPGTLVHDRVFSVYAAETLGGWMPNYGNETASSVKAYLAASNWEKILTYNYLGYLSWHTGQTDTKARYLIVGFEDGANDAPPAQYETDTVPVPEIIIIGSLAQGATPPEPFVRTFLPKPSQDEFMFHYDNRFDTLTSGTLDINQATAAGFSVYGANVTVVEGKNGDGETDGKVLKFQGTIKDPQVSIMLSNLVDGNYESDVWYNIDYKFRMEDNVSAPTLILTDGASGWTPLITREGPAKFKPIWGGSGQVTSVYRDEWHRLNTKFKINSTTLTLSYEVYYDDMLVQKADTTITDTLSRTKPIISINAGDGNTGVFYLDDVWVYRAKPTNNLFVADFNKLETGAYTGGTGVEVASGNNAMVIQPNEGEPGYHNGDKVLKVDSGKTIFRLNSPELLDYIKNHGEFIVDYKFCKDSMNTVPRFMLRNNSWQTFSLLNIQGYTGGNTYLPYVENGTLKYHAITPTEDEWHRIVLKIAYTDNNTLVYSAFIDNMTTPVIDSTTITTENGLVALPLINLEFATTSGSDSVYLTDVSVYKGTEILNP